MLQPTSRVVKSPAYPPRERWVLDAPASCALYILAGLNIFIIRPHAPSMKSAPFESPRSAYQLHYYLCLGANRRKPVFTSAIRAALEGYLSDICDRCRFHLIEQQTYENNLRLVLSLRPEHSVAGAVKKIRGNLSRLLCAEYGEFEAGSVWSRGYFAKSIGKVEEAIARSLSSAHSTAAVNERARVRSGVDEQLVGDDEWTILGVYSSKPMPGMSGSLLSTLRQPAMLPRLR
jgi:REP element-mobilizing transposase RayT